MSESVLARLDRRVEVVGENRSRLAGRLLDEGLRMEEYEGIVFRNGPSGRRAALSDGPDVWEVVADLRRAASSGGDPVEVVARGSGQRPERIRVAAAYYHAYPEEIDARIRENEELERATEAALQELASACGC